MLCHGTESEPDRVGICGPFRLEHLCDRALATEVDHICNNGRAASELCSRDADEDIALYDLGWNSYVTGPESRTARSNVPGRRWSRCGSNKPDVAVEGPLAGRQSSSRWMGRP